MKTRLLKLSCWFAVPLGLLLTGCVTAPLFRDATDIPPGCGVVYFYGQKDDPVAYADVDYESRLLARIVPGMYYVYFPSSGTNTFIVPGAINDVGWFLTLGEPGILRVHIEPGKSYYFRAVGGTVLRVNNTVGRQEIAQCKLIGND